MRNLSVVASAIRDVLPSEDDFIHKENIDRVYLNILIKDYAYSAPEISNIGWGDLNIWINRHIPTPPITNWHVKVLSIFIDKTVSEIEDMYLKEDL